MRKTKEQKEIAVKVFIGRKCNSDNYRDGNVS